MVHCRVRCYSLHFFKKSLTVFFHLRLLLPSDSSLQVIRRNFWIHFHTSNVYCTLRLFHLIQCWHHNTFLHFAACSSLLLLLQCHVRAFLLSQIPSIAKFHVQRNKHWSRNIIRSTTSPRSVSWQLHWDYLHATIDPNCSTFSNHCIIDALQTRYSNAVK